MSFFDSSKCTTPFGWRVIYEPTNGRLAYARGRLMAVFARYNLFEIKDTGAREAHTADCMISLNAETGFNQKAHWFWGTSHSLA